MSTKHLLTIDILRQSHLAIDLLSEYFDLLIFDSGRLPENVSVDWFKIEPQQDAMVFAKEGAGGYFIQLQKTGNIAYISSEGQAGIIAQDLNNFLCLVIAHPYWQDLLHFSDNGNLDEMQKAMPLLEDGLVDDEPEINDYRKTLISLLSINTSVDLVNALHDAVTSSLGQLTVKANDDSIFGSLFGRFAVNDNPFWRNR